MDALATTRSGNLAVKMSGGSSANPAVVDAKAKSIALTLSTTNTNSDSIRGASYVQLSGDVETATVDLGGAFDYRTGPTAQILNTLVVTPTDGLNTATGTDDNINNNVAFNNLGALTSLTVSGTGIVTLDNTDADTKLVTIDLSGVGGVKGAEYAVAGTVGDIIGSTAVSLGSAVAETVTLGSGTDVITATAASSLSQYSKMDTITGFDSVKETADNKSVTDSIVLSGSLTLDGSAEDEIAEVTLTAGAVNLDLALIEAIAASGSSSANTAGTPKFFHFEGNTYVVADQSAAVAGTQKALDDTDFVLKIVGIVALDNDWGVYGG